MAIKVLFVSESASAGGAPNVMNLNIQYIDKQKFALHAVFGNPGPSYGSTSKSIDSLIINYNSIVKFGREFQKIYIKPYVVKNKFTKLIQKINPDVIFQNTLPSPLYLEVYKKFSSIPLIVHLHGLHVEQINRNNLYLSSLIDRTDFFIACADDVKKIAIQSLGVDSNKISAVYNGLPANFFQGANIAEKQALRIELLGISDEVKLIGAAGSFSFAKGVDLFIDTAKILISKDPTYKFIWLGQPGPYTHFQNAIKKDIASNKLTDYFIFPGQVEDVFSYYKCMDCFAMFSRAEALPMVLLESMFCDIPVVGFKIGGIEELIQDAGRLVPFPDTIKMAEAIEKIVRGTNLSEILEHQKGLIRKHFKLENNILELERIINMVAKGKQVV